MCLIASLAVTFLTFADAFEPYFNEKLEAKCKACNVQACTDPGHCPAGMVKDSCDCCYVCGRREGELCDIGVINDHDRIFDRTYYTPKHGRCGRDLECVYRNDLDLNKLPTDNSICQCSDPRSVCGDDNRTYKNKCNLIEKMTGRREHIQIARLEPCDESPQMIAAPKDLTKGLGQEISLSCEVTGYPPPVIEWAMQMPNGVESIMPGDDVRKSVQTRGGPLKYQVTSWLQIQDTQVEDTGYYTCHARNKLGKAAASAELRIIGGREF